MSVNRVFLMEEASFFEEKAKNVYDALRWKDPSRTKILGVMIVWNKEKLVLLLLIERVKSVRQQRSISMHGLEMYFHSLYVTLFKIEKFYYNPIFIFIINSTANRQISERYYNSPIAFLWTAILTSVSLH